jgi:hypothetical protein
MKVLAQLQAQGVPLTPWFSVDAEPPGLHGVYQLGTFTSPIGTEINSWGYAWWDYRVWATPATTIEDAYQNRIQPDPPPGVQPHSMFWRGLAVEPK